MTTTVAAPIARGRHRLGRVGLIHVASFVQVVYRSVFTSWRHPAKHRLVVVARPKAATPAPAAAH